MHNLLMITSTELDGKGLARTRFYKTLRSLPNEIVLGTLNHVLLAFGGEKTICEISGRVLDHFSLVYIRRTGRRFDVMEWQALHLLFPQVEFILPLYSLNYKSKLVQMAICQAAGISIPRTVFVSDQSARRCTNFIVDHCDLPVVSKKSHGSLGENVEIHHTKKSLYKYLKSLGGTVREYIFQEFIPSDGDFRLVVMDHAVCAIGKRCGQKGEWRHNISLGGTVQAIPVTKADPKIKKLAEKCAQEIGMIIAGIDIIQHRETGKYYVLEANPAPGMVTPGVSEAYLEFFKRKLTSRRARK